MVFSDLKKEYLILNIGFGIAMILILSLVNNESDALLFIGAVIVLIIGYIILTEKLKERKQNG